MRRRDGRAVHVRKATHPKPQHQTLNSMLELDPNPSRNHRVLVRAARSCRLGRWRVTYRT